MADLTNRQQEILTFMRNYVVEHGHAPTHSEIRHALNIKSCAFLNRVLAKLEAQGCIERTVKRKRRNITLCISPYSLMLLGKIAAGAPIEAINQPEQILLTEKILGENRYLLQVKGDSMVEDNICDGDWIICETCTSTPPAGTIVIALIKGQEATLKRIFYEAERIRLEPSNKNYKAQFYAREEVNIQGRYIGLIRLEK